MTINTTSNMGIFSIKTIGVGIYLMFILNTASNMGISSIKTTGVGIYLTFILNM
jgi:hypothetical protein